MQIHINSRMDSQGATHTRSDGEDQVYVSYAKNPNFHKRSIWTVRGKSTRKSMVQENAETKLQKKIVEVQKKKV